MSSTDKQQDDAIVLVDGFQSIPKDSSSDSKKKPLLEWYCAPDSWETTDRREGKGGWFKVQDKELIVAAPSKKDFWRRTYYTPTLVKDDGPCLFATLSLDQSYMVETSFTLHPKRQFDQAGLCIRLRHEHWLKTGIEVVDEVPRLSCVVTNVFSDWSTQTWPNLARVRIRVHVLPHINSYVVEAAVPEKSDTKERVEWTFVRIAHLSTTMNCNDELSIKDPAVENAWQGPSPPSGFLWAGVFACCPEDQSGSFVTFHDFSVVQGSTFQHDADGNHE